MRPADRAAYAAAAAELRRAGDAAPAAVVGFDAFIDEKLRVLAGRDADGVARPMADMAAFGSWAAGAAGRSSLREITVDRRDPGGCALNLGDGLAALGAAVDLVAGLGTPADPLFAPVTARMRSVTALDCPPGRTLALEFPDGKLMLAAVAQLAALDPALAQRQLVAGGYRTACAGAELIALTNWSLYPHMTAVWRLLAERLWSALPRPRFLIDLVDPGGRSDADVRAMLALLPRLGGPVTLGLNLNEANHLARLVGVAPGDDGPDLGTLAAALRARLRIAEVVVHALRYAAGSDAAGATTLAGPYTPTPRTTTGAGDRFNAGYALGLMLDLPLAERLALGAASSGVFVREARSATRAELAAACAGLATGGAVAVG